MMGAKRSQFAPIKIVCTPETKIYLRQLLSCFYIYLEPEEVYALNEAKQDMDSTVIGEILEHTLIDIAHRNNCSEDIIQKWRVRSLVLPIIILCEKNVLTS